MWDRGYEFRSENKGQLSDVPPLLPKLWRPTLYPLGGGIWGIWPVKTEKS